MYIYAYVNFICNQCFTMMRIVNSLSVKSCVDCNCALADSRYVSQLQNMFT